MLAFSLVTGRMEVAPEHDALFLRSTNMLFLIFILLSFLGIFAFLARGRLWKTYLHPSVS